MDKKEYYLYVKGKAVAVSEEVYKAYWNITEHEKYLIKKDWKHNVIPFSALDHDGHFVDNIIDERIDLEKIVEVKMQIEDLHKALATLTKEERELMEAMGNTNISICIISDNAFMIPKCGMFDYP